MMKYDDFVNIDIKYNQIYKNDSHLKLELYFEKMAERSCKNCGKTYKKLLLHLHFNETCCGQYTNTEKDEIRLAVKTYRASKRKEYNRTANKRNRQKKETATKKNNPNLKKSHAS